MGDYGVEYKPQRGPGTWDALVTQPDVILEISFHVYDLCLG